jgi:hypothetical protein
MVGDYFAFRMVGPTLCLKTLSKHIFHFVDFSFLFQTPGSVARHPLKGIRCMASVQGHPLKGIRSMA